MLLSFIFYCNVSSEANHKKKGDFMSIPKVVLEFKAELTMEELEEQLANPDSIPLWRMHPVVQHCLRCYRQQCPESIEYKNHDMNDFGECNIRVSQMFFEKYRLKKGHFDVNFIRNCTCADNWQYRDQR